MPEENVFRSLHFSCYRNFTVKILQEVHSKWETFTASVFGIFSNFTFHLKIKAETDQRPVTEVSKING